MAQPLRLSIVLATYDGAKYLPAQLQSLVEQQRLPDELVVSDDASSDGTVDLVQAFAAGASFPVRVHRQPVNLGPNQNFGAALALATGDVLFPCDQDDVWHPDKLARVAAVFEQDASVGLVLNDAGLVDPALRPLGRTLWDDIRLDCQRQDRVEAGGAFEVFARGVPVYGCTLAVRSSWRPHFLPVPQNLSFDAWIGAITAACAPSRLVRESLQVYRQHAGQVTGLEQGSRLQKLLGILARNDTAAVTAEVRGLKLLLDRLATLPASPYGPTAKAITMDRLKLSLDRQAARASVLWRLPLVTRCIVNGSYARSARGLYSAAVDLLAKPERFF